MKFQVAVTMESPIVWHAARLHLRLLCMMSEILAHIKSCD